MQKKKFNEIEVATPTLSHNILTLNITKIFGKIFFLAAIDTNTPLKKKTLWNHKFQNIKKLKLLELQ